MRISDKDIICRANLLYGGVKEYHAVIVKTDFFPGTGDYEDPVEIREDRDIECYWVNFEDMTEPGNYSSGRLFESLDMARTYLEQTQGFIGWQE